MPTMADTGSDPDANDLEALAGSGSQPGAMQCCCGNTDCVLLKHNCSLLDSVERDVHAAARIGQALLARHEALMASAENERFEMQTRIDQLETDKKSLEVMNARTIQENRALLDQLEALNNCITDSETHIKTLEANLASAQLVVRRMEGHENRAAELESELGVLETEQAELQSTLVMSQAEARSAMSRWRKAEKGISDLQEKLERIEREAREERDRHSDMVSRMEKQRNREKDLNTAAGRLKGAAAAKTIGDGKHGAVVSHFVRDLLSDNASLQLGIAELREMLLNSNDEIQLLREQLIFHQPAEENERRTAPTLQAELAPEENSSPETPLSPQSPKRSDPTAFLSQELHIHHHYHAAKPTEPRKPLKKKRQNLLPNNFASPRPFSPSGPANPWRLEHRSTSPAIGHSTKDSISTLPSARWSVFSDQPSDFAPSSVPSSPMSHHRKLSVFDRDNDVPTSPTTSLDPTSPAWTRQHRSKKSTDAMMRHLSTVRPLYLGDVPEDDAYAARSSTASSSPSGPSSDASPADTHRTPFTPHYDETYETFTHNTSRRHSRSPSRPSLHRKASVDSVLSLTGGLDIHTLQSRPSQLAFRTLGVATAEAQVSATFARPTIARGSTDGKRGSVVLRDNLLSLPSLPNLRAPAAERGRERARPSGLGRLVSRLWAPKDTSSAASATTTVAAVDNADASGASTPTVSSEVGTNDDGPSPTPTTVSSGSSIIEPPGSEGLTIDPNAKTKAATAKKVVVPELVLSPPRTFGINQPGVIPGFSEYWAAHQARGPAAQIVPRVVDLEGLREAVEGG